MVRPSSSLLLLLLLLAPGWAVGLGLGEIKLGSNLNQRLHAEIPLFALRPNDVEGMRIALASAELFRRAGVERAFHLTSLRFQTVDNGDGTGSIKITTPKVVNEPFLNFLLKVQWPNGRLVREFTLLLDPPVYGARLNAIVAQTVPTVRSAPPKKLPANPDSAAPVQREPRRVGPRNVFAAPLVSQSTPTSPGTNQTATSTAGGTYGPVKRNDSLWSLAQRLRPDSRVSVHQMMLALLQANPSAFVDGNVNALRAGVVLRVPGREEAQANSQDDALAEVRRQNTDWESIRRAVADNAARRAATTAQTEPTQTTSAETSQSSGAQTSAEQTSADAAVETKPATPPQQQDGKLQIVGADSGNAVGSGGNDQLSKLSEQLALVREELTQSRGETEELTTKLTEAESIITDMERLAQIRDNQLAQLQAQLTQTQAALETATAKLQEQAEQAAEQARLQAAAQQAQPDTQTGAQTQADSSSETAGQQASNSSQEANSQTQGGQAAQSGEQATAQKPADTAIRPKVETSPQPPVAPAGPLDDVMALLDDLMGAINSANPSVLVGAGGAIVLLLGLTMFLRGRRRNRDADRSLEEVMLDNAAADADGQTQFGAAAAEGKDTDTAGIPGTEMLFDQATDTQTVSAIDEGDDATQMGGNLETSSPGPDEDPLQEANVYLAYERFDQARDVVNKAITNYPKRPEYRLKLLEIFHMMGDRASFDAATAELESVVDADSSLLTSARALAADFPDGSPAAAEDTGVHIDDDIASSTSGISNELDFDLGFGDDVVADSKEKPAGQTLTEDLDFDLGDVVGATGTVDASDPSETTLDFELDTGDSGPESAEPSTRVSVGTEVDFDLGGHQESAPFAADQSSTSEVDFDLAFGTEDTVDGEEPEASTNTDIDFDLDEQATASGSELGIDMDVSIDSAATADNDDVFAVLGAEPDTGSDELVLDLDDEGEDLDIGLDIGLDIEEGTNTPGADEETDTSKLAFDLSAFADDDGLPLLDEVGSDEVNESSEVVVDLLAVEETADMSDVELEPDVSGDDIPEFSLDVDGVVAEDDGIPALDDATFEEETNASPEGFSLDYAFDAAADGEEDEEEFTIDLELSDRSAPTIRMDLPTGEELPPATTEESVDELSFDLVFDAEDIPEEALQTQTQLGEGELELSPAVEDEGGEPNMTPQGPQAGIGAETADGNASPVEPSDGGGGLHLDLSDLGWDEPGDAVETGAQRADTLVGVGIPGAGAVDDAELDFDLTDFDPLADGSATIADNTGTLVAPTEDPEVEPHMFTLGTVDDEDEHETAVLGDALSREVDAVQTQLDLAQEYVQLGDSDAAREALEEVIADGNETQQKVAREMLDKLSS